MASTPSHQHLGVNGRPAALAACAVVAVALNAAVIGLASGATAPWASTNAHIEAMRHRSSMLLVSVPAPEELPAAGFTHGAKPSSQEPDAPPRRTPALLPAARVTTPELAPEEQTHEVLFYSYHEVDNPAFPETDWNLDVDALDKIGVQRLVFEVLVSDRGEVVGCTVLDPSDLSHEVKRDLEKRLSATPVLPALRAGQLVASVRRIELVVASTPPEPPARRP